MRRLHNFSSALLACLFLPLQLVLVDLRFSASRNCKCLHPLLGYEKKLKQLNIYNRKKTKLVFPDSNRKNY